MWRVESRRMVGSRLVGAVIDPRSLANFYNFEIGTVWRNLKRGSGLPLIKSCATQHPKFPAITGVRFNLVKEQLVSG